MDLKTALQHHATACEEHDAALYAFNVAEDTYGFHSVKAAAIMARKVVPALRNVERMKLAVVNAPAKTPLDVLTKLAALLAIDQEYPDTKHLKREVTRLLDLEKQGNNRSEIIGPFSVLPAALPTARLLELHDNLTLALDATDSRDQSTRNVLESRTYLQTALATINSHMPQLENHA